VLWFNSYHLHLSLVNISCVANFGEQICAIKSGTTMAVVAIPVMPPVQLNGEIAITYICFSFIFHVLPIFSVNKDEHVYIIRLRSRWKVIRGRRTRYSPDCRRLARRTVADVASRSVSLSDSRRYDDLCRHGFLLTITTSSPHARGPAQYIPLFLKKGKMDINIHD